MAGDEPGLTKDVGYQIGVRRTVPHPIEDVWELLTSSRGLAVWVGRGARLRLEKGAEYVADDGTCGQVRSVRDLDRIRLTWQPATWSHDSTVQIALVQSATGTTLIFHQERLADADERARQRDHWRSVADRLTELLGA